MPEYEVNLYYTGFIIRTVEAENEEKAMHKARTEQESPCNQFMLKVGYFSVKSGFASD